jgi:hypothetical protein
MDTTLLDNVMQMYLSEYDENYELARAIMKSNKITLKQIAKFYGLKSWVKRKLKSKEVKLTLTFEDIKFIIRKKYDSMEWRQNKSSFVGKTQLPKI